MSHRSTDLSVRGADGAGAVQEQASKDEQPYFSTDQFLFQALFVCLLLTVCLVLCAACVVYYRNNYKERKGKEGRFKLRGYDSPAKRMKEIKKQQKEDEVFRRAQLR